MILRLVALFIFLIPLNSWGAEPRRPIRPLMPPEFPQSPFGFSKGDQKRGELVYQRNACPSCHAVAGKGGKVGPDLSRIGETRTLPETYRQQLASTHKPPIALRQEDMDDLIAYLQSLKLLQ
jgi:mono/diheme cytochrome c family protein